MNKKLLAVVAIVVVFLVGGCGWLIYRNSSTVPKDLASQGYQTYDARQSDNTLVNHVGLHLFLYVGKNTATLTASEPVEKSGAQSNAKQLHSDTPTAKALYKALTGHDTYNPSDYKKPFSVDLGRVHVSQDKNSWTLKSKELTLTFHKTSSGNWATPDGTIWFPVKTK
ncbi:hypothetical protein [uncultured Lactobacillus sp.]|uniref:hypothetical protein n=1 Tax=uncultured Lactobacillus sp. TaxID=153152 RepID=UPI002611F221|nr:hypothetical protein [uncultured Lactobacillus sp.]